MTFIGKLFGRGLRVFLFQSANTTEAPDSANALAVARPNPDAAPVTSATLFSKDILMNRFLFPGDVRA